MSLCNKGQILDIFVLFTASYQAFCEFIDNSIQATSINNTKDTERIIDVHIFLRDVSKIARKWD